MNAETTEKIMAAMSGGVDSTVSALLLHRAGHDVTGVTCKMFGSNVFDDDELDDIFMTAVDDAKSACRAMDIPHYTFNCKEPFERCVIDRFVDDYLEGRTPNPCIECNKAVKFGDLHRRRRELGLDKLTTGHYARIDYDDDSARWRLLRGLDGSKDQSYMLYGLTQDELAHTIFPLGDLSKDEVRALAAEASMVNADAPESQDICFIPDGDYLRFVRAWADSHESTLDDMGATRPTSLAPGPITDVNGTILGEHEGIAGYTIGQRKGLGIAAPEPLYVIDKIAKTNTLVVGTHDELMRTTVQATDINFVSIDEEGFVEQQPMPVLAKTSYRQTPLPATATFANGILTAVFDESIVRPAPGQALVLYDGKTGTIVLAGGTII